MAEGQETQDLQEIEEGNANGDFSEQPTTENMDTNDQTTGDPTISDDGTNEDDRKVFVGGLSWETTVKDLKEFFSKYGDVVNCTLKTDLETKRSRGFGFVVFSKTETVDTVLNTKEELKLHGKTIEPKRANPRTGSRKIFVGRVDPAYPEDDIKAYFSTFGKVEKIDLPFDKMKAQRRAFVFVEFETEEAMKKVLNQDTHKLGTQEVDIKKATPTQGTGRGGMRGGRGGGRGSWSQGWGNQGYGNQGYGYGYDQSYGYGGYGGGYGGYGDYNQGYGYGGAWNQYNPGYANYGYGYDYSGWGGYGQDQTQQQSSYGKTGGNKRGFVEMIT